MGIRFYKVLSQFKCLQNTKCIVERKSHILKWKFELEIRGTCLNWQSAGRFARDLKWTLEQENRFEANLYFEMGV